jgi:hypothetical protein
MNHTPKFVTPSALCGFSRDPIKAPLGCVCCAPMMVHHVRGAAPPRADTGVVSGSAPLITEWAVEIRKRAYLGQTLGWSAVWRDVNFLYILSCLYRDE